MNLRKGVFLCLGGMVAVSASVAGIAADAGPAPRSVDVASDDWSLPDSPVLLAAAIPDEPPPPDASAPPGAVESAAPAKPPASPARKAAKKPVAPKRTAAKRATAVAPAGAPLSQGIATIETAVGDVRVRPRAGVAAQKAVAGMKLGEGAALRSGPTGRCFIRFGPTDLVRMSPNTELWIAQLKAPKAGKAMTILQLLVGRTRAMLRRGKTNGGDVDFVMSAASAVAAVKGTDFEMNYPRADGPVHVRVDSGVVMMGGVSSWDVAEVTKAVSAMTRGLAGRPVTEGFAVRVESATGRMGTPEASPPRTHLEVVAAGGQVTVMTADGKSKRAWPGDEVPPGARIVVSGGAAVLAGTSDVVEAASGAQFSYGIKVGAAAGGPAEVETTIVAGAASRGALTVVTGTRTATLLAGQSMRTTTGGEVAQATRREAVREAAIPLARRPAAKPATGVPEPFEDVMPELPVLASAAPLLVSPVGLDLPPPPPDTIAQDQQVISASSPR